MKTKTKNKIGNLCAILVAIVFLLSGFAKSADCAYFSNILWRTFQWQWLALSAPVIILTEIALGLLLMTGLYRRIVSVLTALFLVGISAGFLYGVYAFGMTNCGCFGHLSFLNLSPTFTLVRNGIMVVLLILAAVWAQPKPMHWVRAMIMIIGMLAGTFACGYTLPKATALFHKHAKYQGELVENTPLAALQLQPDSSYMVFFFSFDCPFCMTAVPQVGWWEKSGLVDRVIGIATEDSVGEYKFRSFYQDNSHTYPLTSPFTIQVMPMDSVLYFTNDLPMAYVIRHDTIIASWSGEVPPGIFFYQPNYSLNNSLQQ